MKEPEESLTCCCLFTKLNNEMNLKELNEKLTEHGITSNRYYLHGLYGSTDDNDKIALLMRMGKYTIEYEVYYKERGQKDILRMFTDEGAACEWIYSELIEGQVLHKILAIRDLSNMTVSEKLSASGLIDKFGKLVLVKQRAKQMLERLEIDEESIDSISKIGLWPEDNSKAIKPEVSPDDDCWPARSLRTQ